MLTPEQGLCRAYRAARIAFFTDPSSTPKLRAFRDATDDIRAFLLRDGGRPLEDMEHYVQFELDGNREVQEMPLCYDRFSTWARFGADSVAPAFGRAG